MASAETCICLLGRFLTLQLWQDAGGSAAGP